MTTVRVSLEKARGGALLLVNDRCPLAAWPRTDELARVGSDPLGREVLLRRDAARAFSALCEAVRANGAVVPVSGWRAHAQQEALYADCLREKGKDFTEKFVALPGCSEHETGLAIDVGENRGEIDLIRPAFPDTGVCGAFRKAAARFGFIERYPQSARAVTHIDGEPWHFRFIGAPHAVWLTEKRVVLEEYLEWLLAFTPRRPLRADWNGRPWSVFRVPLDENGASFEAPEGAPYSVSADGRGGAVVTVGGAL